MTKVRRGGYVFVTWTGDHPPRHVHVYRDGRLVLRWDLERSSAIAGEAPRHLVKVIRKLVTEGRL